MKKGRETDFEHVRPEGVYTEMDWEVYPDGLYDLLIRIDRDYNSPDIYITENGAAFKDDKVADDRIDDQDRLDYLKAHFEADPQGYSRWSKT